MVERKEKKDPAYFECGHELGILPTKLGLILETARMVGLINSI